MHEISKHLHKLLLKPMSTVDSVHACFIQSSCPGDTSTEQYLNPKVAARMRALRSETEIMHYQRNFYEEALAKLQAAPGFAHLHAKATQNKEQHQEAGEEGIPHGGAPCLSPSRRRAVSSSDVLRRMICSCSLDAAVIHPRH